MTKAFHHATAAAIMIAVATITSACWNPEPPAEYKRTPWAGSSTIQQEPPRLHGPGYGPGYGPEHRSDRAVTEPEAGTTKPPDPSPVVTQPKPATRSTQSDPPQAGLPNIAATVRQARPAVVSITTYRDRNNPATAGSGTGVIIDPSGLVVTNNHVVEGRDLIIVTTDAGQQMDAHIKGADALSDLAVLQLPESRTYPHIPLEPNLEPEPGEWVVAIGNALALPGGPTVTVGVVSAVGRTLQSNNNQSLYNMVQTDTPINPGNSGGPLLNTKGQIVGINTAVIRSSGGGARTYQGIGFAVSSETAHDVTAHLAASGRVPWAWMGLFMADLTPDSALSASTAVRTGVRVEDVVPGGPGENAGIKIGDVIRAMDGTPTPTLRDLIETLRTDLKADQETEVRIRRNGKDRIHKMTLGHRPHN